MLKICFSLLTVAMFPPLLHGDDAAAVNIGFVLTPTSVNTSLGSTATFNCSAATGIIAWIVNGSLLSRLNAQDITTSNAGRIFFLHVPATEEYNNTIVTCAVAILGGNELYSDPVVLRVQGVSVGSTTATTVKYPVMHLNAGAAPVNADINAATDAVASVDEDQQEDSTTLQALLIGVIGGTLIVAAAVIIIYFIGKKKRKKSLTPTSLNPSL